MVPRGRPAAGGGRWVEVAPDRIAGWLDRFAVRHGGSTPHLVPVGLRLTGADGGTAECRLPFGWPDGPPAAPARVDAFVSEATRPRRVALLLVRRGAHAVGVATGTELVTSKVDTRYVQGRTAAGGWSQQRFARRRANQTRESAAAAADHAARLLLADPPVDALVTGGDRVLVDTVLRDPRLAPLTTLPRGPFLDVPEPRQQTLRDAVVRYRAVRVLLVDPDPDPDPDPAAG